MQLKLQIVKEIEDGVFTITQAQKHYGVQCRKTVVSWMDKYSVIDHRLKAESQTVKSPQQRLLELEEENRLLKKQKVTLEKQLEDTDRKVVLFDMMIDLAEREYRIDIKKNSKPK